LLHMYVLTLRCLTCSATEPIILLVIIAQTIFLTIQSAPNVEEFPQTIVWGHSWVDYCLLVVFIFYTSVSFSSSLICRLEFLARIIVSVFIFNNHMEFEYYLNVFVICHIALYF